MVFFEWTRFIVGTLFLFLGLIMFALEVFGSYKFDFVLNRMHMAAVGDTLGIGVSLIGIMIFSGFNFTTLKFLLIIIFLWLASPVSSHLIARLEVTANEKIDRHCEVQDISSQSDNDVTSTSV